MLQDLVLKTKQVQSEPVLVNWFNVRQYGFLHNSFQVLLNQMVIIYKVRPFESVLSECEVICL